MKNKVNDMDIALFPQNIAFIYFALLFFVNRIILMRLDVFMLMSIFGILFALIAGRDVIKFVYKDERLKKLSVIAILTMVLGVALGEVFGAFFYLVNIFSLGFLVSLIYQTVSRK